MNSVKASSISIREILDIDSLRALRLLGGEGGIDKLVQSVNVMEVPDIENWVNDSELLLTTAYSIKNDTVALNSLIPMLAKKNLAGLIIKCRYIYDIPKEMIAAANKYNFPLIEMPQHLSHANVIQAIYSKISQKQFEALQFNSHLRHSMTALVVNGGDFDDVCRMLHQLYGNPICITDDKYQSIASCQLPQWLEEEIPRICKSAPSHIGSDGLMDVIPLVHEGREYSIVRLPIKVGNVTHGYLVSTIFGNAFSEQHYISLEQVAFIAALIFARRISVREVETRYANAFLFDWLSGNIKTLEQLKARAQAIDWKIDGSFVLIVADYGNEDAPLSYESSYSLDSAVKKGLRSALFNYKGSFHFGSLNNCVVLLLGAKDKSDWDKQELTKLVKTIRACLPMNIASKVNFACGQYRADPLALHKSYTEAVKALQIGRRFVQNRDVFFYDDLGIYSMLNSIEQSEIDRILEKIYMPLYEYDKAHKASLIDTVKTFFECSGVISVVANTMYLHYNTVKYRLRQVSELVGIDMKNNEDKLLLQIAIILGECYYRQ